MVITVVFVVIVLKRQPTELFDSEEQFRDFESIVQVLKNLFFLFTHNSGMILIFANDQ